MKEIGGFFELELPLRKKIFHEDALKLNSGRNCLRYILESQTIERVYIPDYTCNGQMQAPNASWLSFLHHKKQINRI